MALLAAVGAASAKTVYVDDSYGADNPPIHQWRSIQDGSYDAAPGDTVSIADGVYYENLTFWNSSVTYEGQSRDGVQVIFNTSAQHVIVVRGANVVLRNLTLIGGQNGVHAYNSGSNNGTIDNVTVDQPNYAGIQLNGGSDWLVQNVVVTNAGGFGLYITGTSYNHTVYNFTSIGTGSYEGIQLNNAHNSRLDQVYISNSRRNGVYFYYSYENSLSNFTINGSGDHGINFYFGHQTTLTDGLINGSYSDGIYSSYSTDVVVSNITLTNHTLNNHYNVYLNQNVRWTIDGLNASGPLAAIDLAYSNGGSISWYAHQVTNSVWNDVPIVFVSNQAGGSYTGPASQLFLVNVTGFTLNVTSTITGANHGAYLIGVHNSTVLGLHSTGNTYTNLLVRDSWDNEIGNFSQEAVSSSAWAGLYVYGGGWNRFVSNNWTSTATIEIAGEFATGASNNSLEGLVCHAWNQCVRVDSDAPDNVVSNSSFDSSSNVCFYVWYGERYRIENTTLDACNIGLYVYQGGAGIIDNVSITDAGNTAIYFYYSSGARIVSSFITRPNYYGINSVGSDYVWVENSIIENATRTDYGLIVLSNSHFWTLRGVSMARATNPIDLNWATGMPLANAQHDVDTSNTDDGQPIVWFTNSSGGTYSGPASLFVAVNSTLLNVSLQSAIQDTLVGGFVLETNNSTISGLNATNGAHNLMVLRAFDNTFSNFTQFGERSTSGGLYLWGSHNNVFKDSVWDNASRSRYGAYVAGDSANNHFLNLTVTGWNLGIYFYSGSGTNFVEWSTFSGNNYGIQLNYNAPIVIANSTLVSNLNTGVYFYYSSGSRIENSTLTDNTYYQVYANNAHYGWLQDCTLANASSQDYGLLYLSNSRYWTLRGNAFSGMSHPIDINLAYNSPLANAQHDIDTSNTVAGEPIVYFTNATGASYSGPVGFFGAVNSTLVNATFTTAISGLTYGGWMVETNNSTFSGLNISGGYIDLFVLRSHDNTLSNYTQPSVRQNSYGGLLVWDSDRNLVVDSVLAKTSTVQYTGIELRGTSEGNIFRNVTLSGWNIGLIGDSNSAPNRVEWSTFTGNNYGIELYYAAPLTVENSTFTDSLNTGFYLYYSSGSVIENSTFAANTYYQIYGNNAHYVQLIDSRLENQSVNDRGLLYLYNSHYWTLRGTAFSNGNFPIDVNMAYNSPIANLQHDIDTSNTVDGRPIVYFANSTGGSYSGPVGFFGAVNSTLLDVTFTSAIAGLYHAGWLLEVNNSTFRGVNASGGYVNVYVARSHDNSFINYSQPSVRQNTYGGLLFWDSDRNTVQDSVLDNVGGANKGVEYRGSSDGNLLLNVSLSGWGIGLFANSISGTNRVEWSTFTGNSYGAEFYYSAAQVITNSTFRSNTNTGLYLYFSSRSQIENTTFADNYYYQIFANNAHYTWIQDSRLENNTLSYGLLYLSNSHYWTLKGVAFANAYLPIDPGWGFAMNVVDLMHDIDPSNTFNGKPIVWFANASGASYTGPVGFLVAANSSNLDVTFTGQTESIYYGAVLLYTDNSTFRNLNVSGSTYNVRLSFSYDNRLENFSQSSEPSGSYGGITFYDSHRNVVDGGSWVNVTGTYSAAYFGWGSSYNTINNVTCVGFYICAEIYQAGAWNTVRNSTLSGNSACVYAYYSDHVQVLNNTIMAGTYSIHFATGTTNAFVYHNNLYQSNGYLLDQGSNNVFDAGYPAGGNFWSNGSHTDNYGGASQSTGGPDGIVDTAQGIYGPTFDYYPLSEPWPPQIALLYPANNSFIQPGDLLYFSVSRYFDNINYSIDNGSQSNFSDPFILNSSGWSQGQHWVRIFCTDATNTSLSAYFVFTVDSTPPTITAVSPSPGSFNDVGTPFNFSVTDPYLANNATWDNGSGSNPFSAPWSISTVGWPEGTWNITINAWDLAGNRRQQTFLYRLDSSFPVVTLSSPPNNSVVGAGTVINLDVSDTFLAQVVWSNGGPFTSLSSPYDISMGGWTSGTYNVTVVATDAALHQTVKVYTFTLDSVPPQITLVSPANNSAFTSGTTIDIEVTDLNLNSVTYDIGYGVSTFAAPYNISTFAWPDGTYTIDVWADDTAGNTAYAQFILYIDSAPPVVTPPNITGGGVVPPGTVITFNVSDPTLANVTYSNGSGDVPLSDPYGVDTSGWADGNYTIVVNATDAAGHTTTGTVNVTIDGTPPSVSLVTPSNGSVITAGTPVVVDISDPYLNWSTWDNGSGPVPFSGPTNISTAGWADGVYNITIVAQDTAGNQQEVTVQVVIDSGPPTITAPGFTSGDVITPGTTIGFNITDPTLQSAGWTTDFGSGTLTDPFDLDTTGWPEGTTNLSVWATDGAGNTAWYNVTVTIDDTPPVVTFVTPSNGSIVPAGRTIDVEIVELNLASATWDNGSGTNSFGSPFDIATDGWADGTYNITVYASDLAGHTGSAVRQITIDSTPPQITLNSPSNGSSINAGDVIDLDIVEAFLETATWDNGSGQVVFSSPFDINTTGWAGGTYNIHVYANDLATNYAWLNFTVTIDTAPPSVSLVSPSNGSVVVAGTTLVFNITDTDLVSTSWDDGSGAQSFATDFEISTTGWSDGTFLITVNATDGASNMVSVWFVFVIDSTPPSVTLNSPSGGAYIPAGTTLDLSVSDANLASVVWDNGSGPVTLASPYDISTTGWADGAFTVTVRAQDLAGLSTWNNFTVTIDSTPPSISLTSPSNGSYIPSGTTLNFSVVEANLDYANWNNGSGSQVFSAPFDISTTGWVDGVYMVTVQARDLAGNTASQDYQWTIDTTLPSVTLNSPSLGAYVTAGTTLDLSVVETNLDSVTWDNGSGPFTLVSPWDISTSGWADGTYTVTVRALDLAGLVGWNNFTVHIDSTPPALSLTSPANGSFIRAGTVLDLAISDANLDTATWNNGSGPITFTSPFNISTLGWSDGVVTVTVNATDLAGNSVQQDYQWTIDTTLPNVNLLSPLPGAVVKAGTTIDLSVSDTNLAGAGWLNATTGGTLTSPWDISTTGWLDGPQSISVFADDLAGNRRWYNFTLTIDSTPPSISLWTPANNSYIRAGTPIVLNISDLTLASATWNNVTSGDLPFATNFTVPTDGWIDRHYNVTVRAVDGAGSFTTRVFHFVLDSTPPQLVLVSPANDSWLRAGAIIDYTIADANPLTVNLTGSPVTFTNDYDLNTTGWADGDYNVFVRVSDPAGNNVSLRNTFHIDSTAPVINATVPSGGAFRAGVPLSFTIVEPNLASALWRNSTELFRAFAVNFTIQTTGWPDATPSITVQAQDLAGNTASRTFNYTIDSAAPVVSVVSPANYSYMRSDVQLVLQVVDSTSVNFSALFLQGLPVLPQLVPGPNGTWVLPLAGASEGYQELNIHLRDAASNWQNTSFFFTIDNSAPILPSSLVQMTGYEDRLYALQAQIVDALTPPDLLDLTWQFDDSGPFQALITLTGNNATWNFTEPGTYNISLSVTDPAGNANNTTYTILIFDTTPPDVNNWNDYIQWPEDTAFNLTIQAVDNSNQTLNFSWTVPGTNLSANSSNISWVFPTPGVYNITLIVTDPSGNAVAQYALFNITDITPPEIELVGPTVVDLLQQANFTVNVTDNDPRFGYANWSYVWQFTNGTGPHPGGTARNSSFLPRTNQTVTVAVTVVDAAGNSNFLTRQLVVNVPPLVVGAGPPEASVDEDWEWTVDTFDPETGGPVPITIVFGPDGLEVDGNTLHWRPAANQTGPQNVTIELDDGTTKVRKTFTLYVGDPSAAAGNHAPYWVSVPLQDSRVNHEYVYTFEARDDDAGQTLQYFLSFASEEGFRLDENTHQLRWFPPWHPVGDEFFMRNVTISLVAFDGYAYANQTFVIRFRNPPNQWPVLHGQAALEPLGLNETARIQIARYWSDPDDPLDLLYFVVNGTFEDREAIAGRVDWYVDNTNPLDPYLVITAKSVGTVEFKLVAKDPSGGTSDNNTFKVVVGSGLPPPAENIPWWLMAIIIGGIGIGLAGVAVAVRRSRAATAAAQSATRTAETALETASRIPEAVVQPAEPLPAKGTKKDTYVIEAVFIIYDDGRLIYSKTDISEVKFEDPELVASMFSAVQSFIKDSFQQTGELDRLGFGENTIMIERANKVFMAAVIFGQPTEDLRDGMKETLTTIENAYAGIIEDWDGSTTSLEGIEGYVLPFLATTSHLTRKDVELALTEKGVKMVSQLEFFQGFVRLKCGVKNDTDSVITKVTVSIDYNEDVLRLHHIEPDSYKRQGSEVQMGVLNPQEKASLAYYFDPQICTESMIDGIARYRDSKGAVHSVNMKTRKAEVVCPIFFTKEHANTAMLKRLVEGELDQRDSKVYSVEALADGMTWKDLFALLKDVVLSHDVHLVRDFIHEDPYQAEVWFYGETKVKNYKIVIRASVHEATEKIEFFAASTQIPAITGLLAEFNHTLQSMAKSKHPGLFIVPEFDEAVKEEVEKKSLMPKMQDAELESGETEQ